MTSREPAARTAVTKPARQVPGDPGMWVFVLGDLVIFSVYFVIFMVHRAQEPGLFLQSQQHLDPTVSAVNTLVLLTSSWFIALAVHAARDARYATATRLLYATAGCGLLFIAVKAIEWTEAAGAGHTFASNNFFMFYYALTGVHLVHVVMGLIVLGVVRRQLSAPGDRAVWAIETGAVYWHMVDLLWIVIFALVFVLR
jgi:nitric oxide reductase NorE protein